MMEGDEYLFQISDETKSERRTLSRFWECVFSKLAS